MLRNFKNVIFLIFILFIGCNKEEHYEQIIEKTGTGLPLEINDKVIILSITDPFVLEYDKLNGSLLIDKQHENTPTIEEGNILILSLDTAGVLRRVNGLEQDGVKILTEQATLEDVFLDGEFKLSTDLIAPNSDISGNLKQEAISKALTDKEGFIHPYAVVYHTSQGEIITKKITSFDNLKNDPIDVDFLFGDALYKKFDLTGESIYSNQQRGISLSIDSGYVEFAPVFKFEFEFTPLEDVLDVFRIKSNLIKLKFYSDRTKFDFKMHLKALATKQFNEAEKGIVIKDNLLYKGFIFVVGPVPVYIDVSCDLKAAYNVNLEASLEATVGYRNLKYLTYGFGYENGGWEKIQKIESFEYKYPLKLNGEFQMLARAEVYPVFDLKLYSMVGPYMSINPFIEARKDIGYNLTINRFPWISKVDLGLDLKGGVKVDVIKKTWYDKEFVSLNLATKNLYSSPDTILIESGNAQTQNPQKSLSNPISVKVIDNLGLPVKNVPVFFTSAKGDLGSGTSLTGIDGIASISFITPNDAGDGIINASIKNDQFEDIEKIKFSYNVVLGDMPTISGIKVTDISKKSLTIEYEIEDEGGTSISEHGLVCSDNVWDTYRNPPDIDNYTQKIINSDGNTKGKYLLTITNLKRGTQYYIRAYATNRTNTNYTSEIRLTTDFDKATIEMTSVGSEETRSAIGYASITDDGGGTISESGFVYNTTGNPSKENNDGFVLSDQNTVGSFKLDLLGLTPDTRYYVKAFVVNSKGPSYSNEIVFNTAVEAFLATVEMIDDINNITKTSAVGYAKITDTGGTVVTEGGLVWNKTGNPSKENNDGSQSTNDIDDDEFDCDITNLSPGTTYYVKAYVINSVGTSLSTNQIFFTTDDDDGGGGGGDDDDDDDDDDDNDDDDDDDDDDNDDDNDDDDNDDDSILIYPKTENSWTGYALNSYKLFLESKFVTGLAVGNFKWSSIGVFKSRGWVMFDLSQNYTVLNSDAAEIEKVVCYLSYIKGEGVEENTKFNIGEMTIEYPNNEDVTGKMIFKDLENMEEYSKSSTLIQTSTPNKKSFEIELNDLAIAKLRDCISNRRPFVVGVKLVEEKNNYIQFGTATNSISYRPRIEVHYKKK